MARLPLLLLLGILIACAAGALAGSEILAEDNPIRQVVDGFHELESSIVKAVGSSRRAFSFARFAHRLVAFLLFFFSFCILDFFFF